MNIRDRYLMREAQSIANGCIKMLESIKGSIDAPQKPDYFEEATKASLDITIMRLKDLLRMVEGTLNHEL